MKVKAFDSILMGVITILLMNISFHIYQYQRWERGEYEVAVFPGDEFIRVNSLVTFSSKEKWVRRYPHSPISDDHVKIHRPNTIFPKTLIRWQMYEPDKYLFPDSIHIKWLDLDHKQFWKAKLGLPDGYWKEIDGGKLFLTSCTVECKM